MECGEMMDYYPNDQQEELWGDLTCDGFVYYKTQPNGKKEILGRR